MIVFTGIAKVIFKKREDGAYESFCGGEALTLAASLRALKNEVSFISALSDDVPGSVILDFLVKNRLLFDPALISCALPSALVFEDGERRSVRISLSAPAALSEEALLSACSEHTDIEAIVASAEALCYEPISSSILSVSAFISPRPVLIIDPAAADADGDAGKMRKHIPDADLLLLEKSDLEILDLDPLTFPRAVVTDGENAFYYQEGRLLKKEKFISKAYILSRLKFKRKETKIELEDFGK